MKKQNILFLLFALIVLFVLVNFPYVPPMYANPDVAVYYPSEYVLLGSTTYVSGSLTDLQSNDSVYMTFQSYGSSTSIFYPISNMNFTDSSTGWTTTTYVVSGIATYGYDNSTGNPSPGSGVGSYFHKAELSTSQAANITFTTETSFNYAYGNPVSAYLSYAYELNGDSFGNGSSLTIKLVKPDNSTVSLDVVTLPASPVNWTYKTNIQIDTAYFSQNGTYKLQVINNLISGINGTYIQLNFDDIGLKITYYDEYTTQVEFVGSSNTYNWTQIIWTIDSAWTEANVSVTLQLFNYTLGGYPISGYGYIFYISSSTSNVDETKSQNITVNPEDFRDSSGNWKIKITGVKSTTSQFELKVDFVEFKVEFINEPPVASFTESAETVYTGEVIVFNASESYDPDGNITSYFWDFGDGTNATGVVVEHSYADDGVYNVTLTVTDDLGATSTATATKTILNRPPVASFTESAETVYTNETITFNASDSYDSDGSIVSYFWDFGDGTNATGVIVEHAYADDGNYTVTLTVTDDDGATATATATKTILNRSPVALFTESTETAYTSEIITFNATDSYDPDGSIVSYFWDFGDGTNATGVTVEHSYADNGTYTVTLTVTDDDGATGTATATKTILNSPPVASFTESAGTVYTGETIFFNASDSYDPDGSIVSYFWDFGDGSNATGITVEHAYADDGNYTVTLTVTDDDGATANTTSIKNILNRLPIASFTESAETVYTGETITFNATDSYDPDGSIVSYFWDFGDGTNATGVTVEHSYADDGNYTVTLTVTDDDGASTSTTATKNILNSPPVALFTESAETVYTGETITFNASDSYDSDGSIVSYFWDFGDGSNATGVVVEHSYAEDGNYTVTLTVTDDDGASSSTSATKTILNSPPVAVFTESAETVYNGETIFFNASDSYDPDGVIVSYYWDFGDGSNATGVTVEHAYADDGNYTVTLTVTDDDGATTSTSTTKTVLNYPPTAIFTESAQTVLTGELIDFDASDSYDSDGNITSYFWDFGDGTNATGMIISHAYADDGNYTVTLTVTDNDGATSTTNATKTILNRPPVIELTVSSTVVLTDEVITFNASDSYDPDGFIVSYYWDFDDGTNATGAVVEHAYADNGTYLVTLILTDDDGASSTATVTIEVHNRSPVAVFTESAETVYTGETIFFNASDSYDPDGSIVSYFWDFGDGTNATGITVEHAYADNGTYTVTLNVTDDDGATCTTNATKTILNSSPVAVFTESAETVYTGETIFFNASDSYDPDGSIVSYFWDFGDGTNATGVTVEHAYMEDGNYTVILMVIDDDGANASTSTIKTILNRSPIPLFTESAETVYTGETIFFNASDSYDPDGSIVSYFWDFGDGSNATGVTVEHAYADDGNYTVTLTVTDDDGATASTTATKTILNRPPTAVFTESAETVYMGQVIYFNASDTYDVDGYIVSYYWDFGDGSNATGVTVEHTYEINGTYTVTLTVTDDDGATNSTSSTKTILWNDSPVAVFTESAETVYTGETITFNATDSYDPDGNITSYFWDFGDGTNATGVIVEHSYADDGNYTVTLTVTDNIGATGTATATKTVLNRSPVAVFTESAETVYTGETIFFNASDSYDPDGSIVSYFWDFGDGTNATGITAEHTYADDGNYTVTLTVTDDDGASASVSSTKTILNRSPVASFVYSPSFPIAGEIVVFNASDSYDPDGVIVSYYWDFGDGTNATGVTVEHIFTNYGEYTVTLHVTDDNNATGTTARIINIRDYPTAAFTYSPIHPGKGQSITFNASSSSPNGGFIVNYTWDFGDGNITTISDPIITHVYEITGNYTVLLTVTDSEDLNGSQSQTLEVGISPVVYFTYSPDLPFAGDLVTFNASASYDPDGYIVNYTWDFGDGNITTISDPIITHVYTKGDNYMVRLVAIDNKGCSNSTSQIVTIEDYPTADFVYSPSFPIAGETVTFNASSSSPNGGFIVNYTWDFGDGTQLNTSDPIATHTYAAHGDFMVTLTVIDNYGLSGSVSKTIRIRDYPIASFDFSPNPAQRNVTTTFNATTSDPVGGTIISYIWDFGDGNVTTTTNPIVTHIYTETGTYDATLTVIDDEDLNSSISKSVWVINADPVAIFTCTPEKPIVGETATFNASDSYDPDGLIVSYTWDFGDGTTGSNIVAYHTFNEIGTYEVTLTVEDDYGNTGSTSHIIEVIAYPTANFTWSPEEYPKVLEPVIFNASSSLPGSGTILNYTWDFNDGNITTTTDPVITHIYNESGQYAVTLTVINSDGLSDSITKRVDLYGTPEANFTWTPASPLTGETITFNASTSKLNGGFVGTYTWDFGDGTYDKGVIVYHTYTEAGTYNVTLKVENSAGLSDTVSAEITVLSAPQVIFTWSPEYPYEYDKIVFNASSSLPGSGTILNYTWDFNDGNITTTTDPVITHIYNESGQYAVALTIINSEGLSNTTSKTVNIAPAESPIADFTYSPPSPGVYGEVTFNASNCIARGGVIVSYTWDFGDGNITTVTTPIISHTYQTEGNYTVALNVTNTAGYWGVVTKQIEVVPISDPTANFTWSPLQPTFNQTITFNASDSMPGWNGSAYPPIVSYTWDFGDGNITTTTDPIIYHAYAQDGNYTVTLTVVDSDGRSGNLTRIVTVTALLGDINGDGKVDIYDVAYVAKRFGSSEGDPEYDPKADFNGDGKIDIYDVATVAKQFGKTL